MKECLIQWVINLEFLLIILTMKKFHIKGGGVKILLKLEQYPAVIAQAAKELNPSEIANYVFAVAKIFNTFYAEHSIANAESDMKKQLRLQLAVMTSNVLKSGMQLLGIQVPVRM